MTAFWPGCGCCGCTESTLGSWSQDPTGEPAENDDAEILSVDEYDQIQSVQLYAEATDTDRAQGYHSRATFNDLLVRSPLPDVDVVSLFLDGGSHEVRLRFEAFTAPHSWGFACQYLVPGTILVQLWRGTTKLGETRVAAYESTLGLSIDAICGSLRGTEFCGGFNNNASDTARVIATTTATHNGGECWVEILDKGSRYHYRSYNGASLPLSTEIAVTSLSLTTCATHCPECAVCDDDGLGVSLSVVVPNYAMRLFSGGPISCSGGTFVLGNEGTCEWSHASDNALIRISIVTVSGTPRLRMRIASCLGYTCSGFETPVVDSWLSDDISIYGGIHCEDFSDVPLRVTVSGTTYTAYVSSV